MDSLTVHRASPSSYYSSAVLRMILRLNSEKLRRRRLGDGEREREREWRGDEMNCRAADVS